MRVLIVLAVVALCLVGAQRGGGRSRDGDGKGDMKCRDRNEQMCSEVENPGMCEVVDMQVCHECKKRRDQDMDEEPSDECKRCMLNWMCPESCGRCEEKKCMDRNEQICKDVDGPEKCADDMTICEECKKRKGSEGPPPEECKRCLRSWMCPASCGRCEDKENNDENKEKECKNNYEEICEEGGVEMCKVEDREACKVACKENRKSDLCESCREVMKKVMWFRKECKLMCNTCKGKKDRKDRKDRKCEDRGTDCEEVNCDKKMAQKRCPLTCGKCDPEEEEEDGDEEGDEGEANVQGYYGY